MKKQNSKRLSIYVCVSKCLFRPRTKSFNLDIEHETKQTNQYYEQKVFFIIYIQTAKEKRKKSFIWNCKWWYDLKKKNHIRENDTILHQFLAKKTSQNSTLKKPSYTISLLIILIITWIKTTDYGWLSSNFGATTTNTTNQTTTNGNQTSYDSRFSRWYHQRTNNGQDE